MLTDLNKSLDYARFSQIALIYTLGIIFYLFTTIPHSWWIFLTVSMVGSALEPGLMVRKSLHRGRGTLIGIILFVPIVYLLQFNYRLVPLALILVSILIWLPPPERYDISVTFITLQVFLLTSYNYLIPTIEGPIEVMINRGFCTIIGISICLLGDLLLFKGLDYSRRVYFLYQHQLLDLFKAESLKIMTQPNLNSLILVEKERDQLNQIFAKIESSGNSLILSLFSDELTKGKVRIFNSLTWELRKLLSNLHYAAYILKDQTALLNEKKGFDELFLQAKQNIISFSRLKPVK